MDYVALKSEIQNDPTSVGYSSVTTGNDQGIADLLNAISSGITVTVASLTKDEFLKAILPVALTLPSKDVATQTKWDRILSMASSSGSIDVTDPHIIGLLSLSVSDGILTSGQASVVGTRSGSRAEQLFGVGTRINQSDISYALRGDR